MSSACSHFLVFLVSLKKILNLNHDVDSNDSDDVHANGLMSPSAAILNEDGEPIWKVLVLDDLGRDVISSVMRVNDLRSMGVTMHMYGSPTAQRNAKY